MRLLVVIPMVIALGIGPSSAQCGRQGIVMYKAWWCSYCKAADKFFREQGIEYLPIETDGDADVQQEMMAKFGTNMVPVIVIDDQQFVVGFNEPAVRQALCLRP
jgi:glutaredoxin